MPSADAIEAIVERLKEACTAGTREPTAVLTAEEHRALLDLHIADPMAAGVVLQHVREHARTLEGWREGEVRRISFRIYETGARAHARQQEQIEGAANVVRLNAQRNARVRRARTHDVTGDVMASLSVPQMLETDSPLLVAFALLRQHREGRLWYDEFFKRTLTDWRGDESGTVIAAVPVIDEHVMRIQRWLHATDRRLVKLGRDQVNQIIDNVANEDRRNAPRDWMASVQWDGEPRLGDLMRLGFGAPDTAFNREAGRCWFVSMVARVFDPGCKVDTMPVFVGAQGITKSQALEVIGGEWYRAAASSIDSKDFLQELHGALVFEIQELHSILASRLGAARAKAVLSTRKDNFRLPYGLRVEEHKRTAVICGTTNNKQWHTDETGGRRYWVVHCGAPSLAWLRRHRAQLFAEAVAYYQARQTALAAALAQHDDMIRAGAVVDFVEPDSEEFTNGRWWNVPADEQAELIEAETFASPFQEMIAARLQVEGARGTVWRPGDAVRPWDGTLGDATDWGNLLTVSRIGVQWLGMSPDTLGRGMAHAKTIGACMQALGYEARQVRLPGSGERVRAYVLSRLNSDSGANSASAQNEGEFGNSNSDTTGQRDNCIDDADIPF